MVCQPMPRPLPPSLEACASISLRSSITISGRNGRPYLWPRLIVETSAEAGRTKAGNAIRPVTNLRLFTLPPDVNPSNSAFRIENPRRFVHAGSLESEQPRRIVGEDALSHPDIGIHSPSKLWNWMEPTRSWNVRCGKSLSQINENYHVVQAYAFERRSPVSRWAPRSGRRAGRAASRRLHGIARHGGPAPPAAPS